jgi:peptide/nickel transport system substrate-binding protein
VQKIPQAVFNFFVGFFGDLKNRWHRYRLLSKKNKYAALEKRAIIALSGKKRWPKIGQLRYLKNFLSRTEKIWLAAFALLVFASFGFAGANIYFNATKIAPEEGGEYTEGIIGYPRFINPLYSPANEADKDLVALVYSGLLRRNESGVLLPDLAEKYAIDDSEKIYTFTLKKNVLWQDGRPFSADDVVFTIGILKDKNYNSPLRAAWDNVAVKKIDDATVQFQLDKPFGNFLTMATVGIMPKHIWSKVPVANFSLAEANLKPVGTGPYGFSSFVKDKVGVIKSYKLEVNQKYYGAKPAVSRIVLKFYPDYISAAGALDGRQIDGLAFVPKDTKDTIKLKSHLAAYDLYLPQFNAIFFNGGQNALLKNKEIRQALALAVDRKKILQDVLNDQAVLIDGPIPRGYQGYAEGVKKTEFNPASAQKILVDAGWIVKDGNKFRINKKNEKMKIVLTTVDKDQNVRAAKIVKDDWEAIGVETEVRVISAADINKEAIDSRNYEALLYGEMYGPDMDPYLEWHSSAVRYPGLNLAMYENANVDKLLERVHTSSDPLTKKKNYESFAALVSEDHPAIFLWQPVYDYLIDKKLGGLQFPALLSAADRWTIIEKGYINTKRVLK